LESADVLEWLKNEPEAIILMQHDSASGWASYNSDLAK
jgi:hypothetical protein